MPTLTKQEITQRLVDLQTANADREITRKFFRDSTSVPDSNWEKYFGNWTQFKMGAGLEHSKTQKGILSATTRHAGVDTLKQFNIQKQGFEGKYLKPSGDRFQTILTGSDIHDKLCDPFYRRLFVQTAARVQPQKIVLAGDTFDFPEFSKYTTDPRRFDVLGAITWVHQLLADLREAAPDAEIIMVEGNHENRLLRYLSEASPAVMPILADLHGYTIPSLLGLDRFEVNYVSRSDLAVFTETDTKKEVAKNYYIAYDAYLFHHFPYAKNWGMSGLNGHHHTHKVETFYSVQNGPYEWTQLGCGHVRVASYCAGEKWSNGFALIHVDTQKKLIQTDYIDCTNEHTVIGGAWYMRSPEEILKL